MSLLWNLLGKPLAMLGGRSAAELRGRPSGDCDKSVLVGLLCLVSVGIIFAGHWLFWGSFSNTAEWALQVATGIALLFAVMYRVALRAMETMPAFGKTVTLLILVALMGVNAMLAGHELVLLAFRPQADEQAKLGAARGVTAYASAVETSLGLPQLRSSSGELDKAISTAVADRSRTPDNVQPLQQQARACEAEAARFQARIPASPDEPGYAVAHSVWREKRSRCGALTRQAGKELAEHHALADKQLQSLSQSRDRVRKSLVEASTQHEDTLKRDSPTVTASATTGFARHAALWAAVTAGTIPAWAAYGLIFAVLAVDSFSFIIKLLMRDDRATIDRIQSSAADHLHAQIHAAMASQQSRLVRTVVRSLRPQAEQDLRNVVRDAVMQSALQDLEHRSLDRAAQAANSAQRRAGRASPSMLGRVGRMARALRERGTRPATASGMA